MPTKSVKLVMIGPGYSEIFGVIIIIPIFVWQSPKGRCYGNQLNLRSVRLHHQEQPLFIASVLNNGSDDRKSSFKRLTRGPHYGAEWAIC